MKILIAEPMPNRASRLKKALTGLIATDSILKDVKLHTTNYNEMTKQTKVEGVQIEEIITLIDLVQSKAEADAFKKMGYAWWPTICRQVIEDLSVYKNQVFIVTVFTDLPFSVAGDAWVKNLFGFSSGNSVYPFFIYKGKSIDKSDLSKKILRAMVALKSF